MASRWPLSTIADCAADEPYSTQIGPFGEKIRADTYTSSGAPVLRGTNVNSDSRFHDDDFVFIDRDLAESDFTKFVCEADDIILCHKGTLGKIGIIPQMTRYEKYIMGNSMMKVRCDQSKLEPHYLYYWLTSREGQSYLFSRVSQVGVPQIQRPLTTLREAAFPLPPLTVQKEIAHILGTLDDKIELNRRMNATLESMARALFQSWFVDFDPVRAKVESLIADGIVEIGDGYRAKNSELGSEGLPFVRAGDLDGGFDLEHADRLSFASVEKAQTKLSRPGDVAFTSKGTVGRIARVDATLPQFVYAPQVCYWRSVSSAMLHPTILYCWMTSVDFKHQLLSRAGQTDMAPYISLKDQRGLTMPIFPCSQAEIGDRLQSLLDMQAANTRQSRTLATLRDALLPKLLSGELSTAEAEVATA